MQNLLALGYSFGYVFLVILIAEAVSRWVRDRQVTRKIIHILCGNWILMAFYLYSSVWWAMIPPVVFTVLNYISYRKDLIPSMEGKKSMGTVYYAISLLVLTVLGWKLNFPSMAYVGILSMTYGDGFAAVLGERFGVRKWQNSQKSYIGSITVFFFTVTVTLLISISQGYDGMKAWPIALLCGCFASYIELYGRDGFDNLSLPIGVGILYYYHYFCISQGLDTGFWLIAGVTWLILAGAVYKQAITPNGAGFAYLVGIAFFAHGGAWLFGALILFFGLGSVTSKFKKEVKKQYEALHQKRNARDWMQVLANSFSILVLLWLGEVSGQQAAAALAGFAVLAAAAADTVSSDLGMLTSGKTFSILTGKPVQKGISGGVSWFGFTCGFFASVLLSLPLIFSRSLRDIVLVISFGFLGTIIDSILGEVLQVKYETASGYTEVEKDENGRKRKAARGIRVINNDWVNFISLSIIAILAFLTFQL